jgi:hypothetical protein
MVQDGIYGITGHYRLLSLSDAGNLHKINKANSTLSFSLNPILNH